MGRTCCVQKLFLKFRTISVHNMFSPCFEKRRASDKDLPVSKVQIYIVKNATDKDKQEQINRGLVNLETSFKQLKNVYAKDAPLP